MRHSKWKYLLAGGAAGLTNGLNASTLACSWACVNGELIQSVPANVAEKVN